MRPILQQYADSQEAHVLQSAILADSACATTMARKACEMLCPSLSDTCLQSTRPLHSVDGVCTPSMVSGLLLAALARLILVAKGEATLLCIVGTRWPGCCHASLDSAAVQSREARR